MPAEFVRKKFVRKHKFSVLTQHDNADRQVNFMAQHATTSMPSTFAAMGDLVPMSRQLFLKVSQCPRMTTIDVS